MKLSDTILLKVLLPALLLSMVTAVCAQVKIGNNPTTINKSSLLELESDSLGVLLPRLKDTVLINSLNPPDGMVIYVTNATSQHFYVRQYGVWVDVGSTLSQSNNKYNLLTGLQTDSLVTILNGVLRKISADGIVTNVINNSKGFGLSNGLKTDSVVTTLNGALRKVSVDSLVMNSVSKNNVFSLGNGLKTDSVVTTLNGALRKVSIDSLVMNSVSKSNIFNLGNGLKTDSVVTTLNGALRKIPVDSLINNSIKTASGYAEPVQVIQAATGSSVFSAATAFAGGTVSFADNEVKKFIYSLPGAKPGDVISVSAASGINDALFIAKSLVTAADTVEITIINGTPVAVSSPVQMSIGLIRK